MRAALHRLVAAAAAEAGLHRRGGIAATGLTRRGAASLAAPPPKPDEPDHKGPIADDDPHAIRHVKLADVADLPRHVSDFAPDLLVKACLLGHRNAIRERLVREVMAVDGVGYNVAQGTVTAMEHCNQQSLALLKLPYIVGIASGFVMAWGCLPFVFDLDTALWFNEKYVTTAVPPPEDLETILEVSGCRLLYFA